MEIVTRNYINPTVEAVDIEVDLWNSWRFPWGSPARNIECGVQWHIGGDFTIFYHWAGAPVHTIYNDVEAAEKFRHRIDRATNEEAEVIIKNTRAAFAATLNGRVA